MKPYYAVHFWTPDELEITCHSRYENAEHVERLVLLKRDGSIELANHSDRWKAWDEDRRLNFLNLAEVIHTAPGFSEAVGLARIYFATTSPAGPEWKPPIQEVATT